ncbi:uncharacterized protein HMPREF1541_07458 [Cyphellophora europaea CBS 101466]|uniref:VHS domain-containing protein n=1 Tax=Cyphellophora europaea (strain CBS 101466) TaxID=1220924 RepID=W2RNC8_CYPE1|nr:uncharacterized protein HMPREF1541_07458 [Cyphellophora europaea CBS 101466]ETN37835.1 hypothetical protein HMPREF1541_07458 [Cyphellophora europaea CBS 101466]
MEATSARMASRSHFEGFAPPKNTLQRFIFNACDPISNYEPNLALNLEIVDLINQKKGTAPREAASTIVQLINHRNPNVSLLAISLLDICVKNCGYPFHLQISTKEFLNELVRRFPERPPLRPSRVQGKILEAIEEWRSTICQTSRYKDDLGFIRDMHRLLLYKGYMFPEVRRDDAAVLNPSDNLQSAEEMEREEREAQSAKLQELIRRGTPADLQEANRLMKVMAGYDTRNKTDYRAKAAEEVIKVQHKAKILEEMLQNHKEGEKIGDGDVFEASIRAYFPPGLANNIQELASALASAHPKIQRMCEEESDDAEAVAKLFEINDSIHRTIERYRLMKAGNVAEANKIAKGTLGTTFGVGKNAANELSLIDFDPEPSQPEGNEAANGSLLDSGAAAAPTAAAKTSVEDDLLGLSLDPGPGQGLISLGPTTGSQGPSNIFAGSQQPPPPEQQLSAFSSPVASPPPPQPQASPRPNYDAFASLTSALPSSKPSTPQPSLQQQQKQAPIDPFAALVSASSRSTTPSGSRNVSQAAPPQNNQASLLSLASQPPAPPPAAPAATDDEWNFASALPSEPESSTIQVHSSQRGISVAFHSKRQASNNANIHITASFSNTSAQVITGLHFQAAVEKAYSLQMRPQSSRELPAGKQNAVQQEILLSGVPIGAGGKAKMRFKVSYAAGGQPVEEQGSVPSLGIQ